MSDLVHLLWQIAHRARASPEEAHGHISVAARHSVHLRAIGAKGLPAHVEARPLLRQVFMSLTLIALIAGGLAVIVLIAMVTGKHAHIERGRWLFPRRSVLD